MTVYRVWPSTDGPTLYQDDASPYSMGMQFRVTAVCTLTAIYFWRAPNRPGSLGGGPTQPSDAFATQCGLWDADTHAAIGTAETFAAPGAATGWIRQQLVTPIALDTTHVYRAAIFGNPPNYSATSHYFDGGGPGDPSFDVGIIHVYNNADAVGGSGGQDSFHSGGSVMVYPDNDFNAANYWLDIEVTTGAASQNVTPSGITSGEASGTPTIVVGAVTVSPSAIASAETFGTLSVAPGPVAVAPVGIATGQAVGTPSVARGPATVTPTGITSAEAFGTAHVLTGVRTVTPDGIASVEAFGSPSLVPGPVTVTPTGISSGEWFGYPCVEGGTPPDVPEAFTDAEGVLKTWLVSRDSLVGPGNPLPAGVHLVRLRSPYTAAWALLSSVGGDDDWLPDSASHRARLSASVYGPTRLAANTAAVAYANTLRRIPSERPFVDGTGRQLVAVAAITGPLYIPDGDDERYLVDADIYLVPAPC